MNKYKKPIIEQVEPKGDLEFSSEDVPIFSPDGKVLEREKLTYPHPFVGEGKIVAGHGCEEEK